VNCVVAKLKPVAGLKVTFSEVRVLVVEYPMIESVKLESLALVICTLLNTGAREGIVNWSVVAGDGVTSTPPVVVKVGARVTVSATVPVWISISEPCPAKSALVLPAGMVKSTVRLPLELPVEN